MVALRIVNPDLLRNLEDVVNSRSIGAKFFSAVAI
jgi:hypothetical protein